MYKTAQHIIIIAVILLLLYLYLRNKGISIPGGGNDTGLKLQYGDSGDDVFRLNTRLRELVFEWLNIGGTIDYQPEGGGAVIPINNGWLNSYVVSGYFGPQTLAALTALTDQGWIYVKDIDKLKLP